MRTLPTQMATRLSVSRTNDNESPLRLIPHHDDDNDDDTTNNHSQQKNKKKRNKSPTITDICPQTGVTLSRYMMELERWNPELSEVESIFTSIQVAAKAISNLVRKSTLQANTGYYKGSMNIQGEEQSKMDVIANDVLKNALNWAGHFKTIASEEEDEPISSSDPQGIFPEAIIDSGKSYIAVFDPLDGSANLDSGIPVGTIFGIFRHGTECQLDRQLCLEDVLQPGRNLVAAGYCLYSSATTLVMTLGDGTHGFTLDETIGEFVLTHPSIQIPQQGSIYSFNEGNRWEWDQPIQDYIMDIQTGMGKQQNKYKARYVGSMVADVHRTLMYGGIFGYPADRTSLNGKLRLLYEAAPMAFLLEQAGGRASTGTRPIMDVLPTDVHARVPVILGSPDDVKELESYYEAVIEKNNKELLNAGQLNTTDAKDMHYA
ncbi:Fructose-1,6-bisphosphatase class 1 [Seminavis robusta]|uniref:fructose-bisphosphatase n=1 Tax=Seminavis robusta TaxID=568900 RepID=A0A9N8EXF5_9STRA|nr:Fructose-1,6-bisphosphatase class 1 [Seminavis robusta]|eukprot:Sro1842_g301030.1 Fructose-1,6-bisphosphatase class 1 (431) ;mRNA; r:4681-6216